MKKTEKEIIQKTIQDLRWAFRNIEEGSLIKRDLLPNQFLKIISPVLKLNRKKNHDNS